MLRGICFALLAGMLLPGCATSAREPQPIAVGGGAGEAERQAAAAMVETARTRIETFLRRPFVRAPRITLAANRAEFNATFPAEWGMSETQCWMVGVGSASFLAVLAQSDWAAEACEHDPNNPTELQQIITHELTHTYHGQFNPTGDFTGMDDMGWFVEGLAVLVSGQMQLERNAHAAAEAIAANAAPTSLATAWSGRYRYGVSGSLVQYIDETYGRGVIVEMLAFTTNQQALQRLGRTEQQFLADWRAWALRCAG